MIFEYRGVSTKTGKMVFGQYTNNDNGATIWEYNKLNPHSPFWRGVIEETVGLASSRKDRNGKTVFDGDILHKTQTDGSGAYLEVVKYTGDNWDNIHNCEESEIIGDIHLNKNLLK